MKSKSIWYGALFILCCMLGVVLLIALFGIVEDSQKAEKKTYSERCYSACRRQSSEVLGINMNWAGETVIECTCFEPTKKFTVYAKKRVD